MRVARALVYFLGHPPHAYQTTDTGLDMGIARAEEPFMLPFQVACLSQIGESGKQGGFTHRFRNSLVQIHRAQGPVACAVRPKEVDSVRHDLRGTFEPLS